MIIHKAILVLTYLIFFIGIVNCQQYTYTFESGKIDYFDEWVTLELDDSGIWQIGKPNKLDWGCAYSGEYVLMTDTVNLLDKPTKASFIFKITRPPWMNCITGYNITMAHKFDLPKGKAGANIEVSYNKGESWMHIKHDTLPCFMTQYDGEICAWPYIEQFYYADTVESMPVASGERTLWGGTRQQPYNEVGKDYLVDTASAKNYDIWLKFTYINTDTIAHKGWIIDDLFFSTGYWCEFLNVNENIANKSSLYPNPVKGESVLYFDNENATEVQLVVFNMQGKMVYTAESCSENFTIAKSTVKPGPYVYKLISNNEVFANGKFIVE